MSALRILHLSDGRPGHYHLAEGVMTALSRLRPLDVQTLRINRRKLVPARYLRALATKPWCPPERVLSAGYGLDAASLPDVDLVISSGGETLPANLAAKRLLGAENIFIGSTRKIDTQAFSLIVSSYARHEGLPRHLVTLKPSAVDPDELGRPRDVPEYGVENPPKLAGLLIGGNSGLFSYRDEEWYRLFDFARQTSRAWGTRWLVSTSRRTPPQIAQAAFDLAKDKDTVADFIDYKLAGPGTLSKIFARADVIVCSEDSSTMVSEAVWARLPVVGVSPERHAFKPEEAQYRQTMLEKNWARFIPIADLSVEQFSQRLGEIRVLDVNPLEKFAGELKRNLPGLFANPG